MRFSMMRAILIALFSASLTVKSYGELIMIRHPPRIENGTKVQDITCMSEKNGNALISNEGPNDLSDDTGFTRYYVNKCAPGKPCFEFAESEGWNGTTSLKSPMGPVSDFRWEDFKNYEKSRQSLDQLEKSGTIVFSARGSKDLNLRFGENNKANHSCFRITFAASEHTKSQIRACNDEGSDPMTTPGSTLISPLKWRTYIIKWDGNDKIEVKQPGRNRSSAAETIMEKKVDQWMNVRNLVVENSGGQRIRFHFYRYRLSTKTGQHVTFNILTRNMTFKNLYVELVVSLCPKCQLEVQVIGEDAKIWNKEVIYGDKTLPETELPVWQTVRLNISLSGIPDEVPLRLRVITKAGQADGKGRWAFDQCFIYKPEDAMRESTRKFDVSSNDYDFSCQELSNDDRKVSVVHYNRSITKNVPTSLDQCFGIVRKSCNFHCGNSCKGTSICNSEGCFCASGFEGASCDQACPNGKYGYNCQQDCLENCGGRKCDNVTGCQTECRDYFLPPNCEKELEQPKVECINETGVRLNYTMNLNKDERTYLRFETTETNASTHSVEPAQKWEIVNLIPENAYFSWPWSNESIRKLKPMTEYSVRAVMHNTRGPQTIFDTKCWESTKPQNVSLIAREDGNMTLKWRHYPRFWERTERFEVRVEVLDSEFKRNPAMHNLSTTTNSSKERHAYRVGLQLLPLNNYTFSIEARDRNFNKRRAISLWYLIPDEATFERSEDRLPNSTMKRISFRLPNPANTGGESISDVIMKRSYTCPIFERNRNTSKASLGKPDSFEEGEYPACTLSFEETYLFIVAAPVDLGRVYLFWILVLPIFGLCWLMFYVMYWRPKRVGRAKVKLPVIDYAGDTKLHPINDPEELLSDGCVPPEMQKLRKFENYIRRAAENGLLQQQFMSLPKGLVRPCDYGRLPDNRPKNRYGNLIAYDDTRVMLITDSRGAHSDYINANYVQGYCKEKAYIATQGPLPETVVDFWRMIWQEEVRIICMLVDLVESGKNMCEQYWPEIGEEIKYGDIVILTTHQHVFADFTYRTFHVTNSRGTESHTVEHLQYTAWPEEGVPMYSHSVVEFMQKLLSVPPGQGPVVVHCNSGTGRTGVIILADICWRYFVVEGTVDVFAEAKKMYHARANMLRNLQQYVLSHLVPAQCLIMLPAKILCSDMTRGKIEEMKKDLPTHLARLTDCSWMDKALRPLEPLRPPVSENILKNRFPKLTPVGPSLVTLTRYPTYDDNSDYISAVSVDGVEVRKQYIASQLPMPSTLTDFWRMIVEKNIELVIILQQPDLEDDTCCDIIPRGTTVIPVPYLKVEAKSSSSRDEHFTTDKLLLTDTSQNLTRTKTITTLTCNNWSPKEVAQPPAPETLVELWRASERIKRDGLTLVLCYDGITACGLYLTLSYMLERMGIEQECDVILAIRAVRRSRPEFMCFQWQFEYLYDAALKYAESFQNYGNFTRVGAANHRCE